MTNVAIENGPFIVDFPSYKMVIFNSYVKLPEGNAKRPEIGTLSIDSYVFHPTQTLHVRIEGGCNTIKPSLVLETRCADSACLAAFCLSNLLKLSDIKSVF